jgi:outer membrane protein TolC
MQPCGGNGSLSHRLTVFGLTLCLGLCGWANEVQAQTNSTNRLTLSQAIQLALQNHPELRVASGKLKSAMGRALQASQWTNPELELMAEEWPVANGGRGFSDAKQTIGIAQTVPYPGKKKLDREIGGSGIHLTEAEADHKRSDLVREVKISFVRVLAADRLATVAEEVSQVAETASATARKRVEAGATGLQEQLRAEIQWEQARAGLDHLRGEAAVARQTLAALLGTSDLFQTTLIGTLVETRQANLLETSTDLLDRHPGLVVARKQVSQAELEEKRTRLDPYPDVKVGILRPSRCCLYRCC